MYHRWFVLVLQFAFVTAAALVAHGARADLAESVSRLGADEVVLPSFEPLRVESDTIFLAAHRSYEWTGNSLLPNVMRHGESAIVRDMALYVDTGNGLERLTSETLPNLDSRGGHHVDARGAAKLRTGANVVVETRVDFDGVGMVTIFLDQAASESIRSMELRVTIASTPHQRMLKFDAATIRKRRKQFVFAPDYRGNFVNAIALADGNASFWWFADDGRDWVFGPEPACTVRKTAADTVEMVHLLVSSAKREIRPRSIHFNFLVTPVRYDADWRRDRITASVSKAEGRYGKYHLWWVNAFAHETLPYSQYPPGVREKLPESDLHAYPGIAGVRAELARARGLGIERLPYFSAHALSAADPAFERYGKDWRVEPPRVMPAGSDAPFTARFARPWLSQNAPGYQDYLLERFSRLAKEIGFSGLYFDQGGVIDSSNPQHGAWVDNDGQLHAATDILALRNFFKRLRTLLYQLGLPGYIFVHNSASPIVPAYTFVTGMVQGEEWRVRMSHPYYMKAVDIDELRTAYAPDQYGIPTYWLSVLWVAHFRSNGLQRQKDWLESREYERAFRQLMGLAVAHDIPVWTKAPLPLRAPIYDVLNRFGTASDTFIGYWDNPVRYSGSENIRVSVYRNHERTRALLVVLNTGTSAASVIVSDPIGTVLCDTTYPLRVDGATLDNPTNGKPRTVSLAVPALDFKMPVLWIDGNSRTVCYKRTTEDR